MKLWVIFFLFFFGFSAIDGHATMDTASTGNWNNSGTWSSGTSPGSGDTLVIPAGVTVTVNCNCGTYSSMRIMVYGTLTFPGGKKINLSANGQVDVFTGGKITGSNGGDKITINGSSVWRGNDSDINGPSSCNSSGCASNPTLPVELVFFDVQCNDNSVEIEWQTASEINNDYFELSFSHDAELWEVMAIVAGAGNAREHIDYEVSFQNTPEQHQFVMLEQVDFDGKRTVEAIRSLECTTSDGVMSDDIKTQRVGGSVMFRLDQALDVRTIEIWSVLGSAVLNQSINGESKVQWTPDQSGVYIIKCTTSSGQVMTKKIVVER